MRVAVAVIEDADNRVLLTQRSLKAALGGRWEFPGGKLEENESAAEALVRELKEEIGIDVEAFSFLAEIEHQYAEKCIRLQVFRVTAFSGTPSCLEDQLGMQWLPKRDLDPTLFPEANKVIIDLIKDSDDY